MDIGGIAEISFGIKKLSDKRYLEVTASNKTGNPISLRAKFRRVDKSGITISKSYVDIINIDPNERMRSQTDLFVSIDKFKYAEVYEIEISDVGGYFNRGGTMTYPASYRYDLGMCFVATVCLGEFDETVTAWREWRDNHLYHRRMGRMLISLYELAGPHLARLALRSETVRVVAGRLLRFLSQYLKQPGT